MTETLAALEQVARERTERDGLTAALAATQARAEGARARVRDARRKLADERADVAALESVSMTRVLAALRGRRDTDLDRERAEAAAAEYAVAEAEARAATESREVASLESRLAAYGDLEGRYAELLTRREGEVRADPAGTDAAARLTGLADRVGELRARATQLDEAVEAGRAAHAALEQASRHLGSAGSWATYDTFFGGGLIGDMVKHDKLDRAATLMRHADLSLVRLSTELADVGLDEVGGIGITSMTKALDVWFDNIFSDWAVRDRINQAADRVHQLLASVVQIGHELVRRQQETAAALVSASAERERLLTGQG